MASDQAQVNNREQRKKRIIMMILLALILMSAAVFLVERKESSIIVVTFPSGVALEAEVADTPEKLLFGLAFRDALPPSGGMRSRSGKSRIFRGQCWSRRTALFHFRL